MRKIGARVTLIAASIALAGCETIGPLWPENPDNYVSYSRVQDPNDLQDGGPGQETEADRAASEDAYLAEIDDLSDLDEENREPPVEGFIQLGWPGETPVGSGLGNPAGGQGSDIALDFEGADLASVIKVIMEDGLDASYILDPRVSGTVTLRTNGPLSRADILPTLEEILRLNNAAIVERNGMFRIIPREEAGLSAPLISAQEAQVRGLTVRVTPLRFVSVQEIADILESLAPVAGAIRYDRSRNLVFTIGTAAEQATILDALSVLDVDYFASRSFALRPLREADAQPVVDELTAAFASPSGIASTAIRFLPVERMNAVLMIAEDSVLLDDAMVLVRNLDQDSGEAARLRIFPVSNRRAADLAILLGDVFGAETSLGPQGGADPLGPSLTPEIGQTAVDTTTDVETAPDVADAAPTASPGLGPLAGGIGGGESGVLRIVADEASNSLLALVTGDGARAMRRTLRRLDTQPLQVMIEATLVEVALNEELNFGVRWFFESGDFSFDFGDAAGTGAASVLPGFNAAFRTSNAQVTISALDAVTDVKILSSPTLMVMDNEEARLQVGDDVPIVVRSSQSTDDPNAPIVTEEEFRETGVILNIRPRVNASGNLSLQIRQEVSSVAPTTGAVNPTFNQRVVESTILVNSGETIALAGLIEGESELRRDGIPVLSRLPLIGPLFGVTERAGDRNELMILIRPFVVRDQSEARAATNELRRKLSSLDATVFSVGPKRED